MGTQVALGDVVSMMFGKKGTKAKGMHNFIAQLGGDIGSPAASGDSSDMGKLRSRIQSLISKGELK